MGYSNQTLFLNFGPGDESKKVEELKLCPFENCDELIPKKARGCWQHKNFMTEEEQERRRNHPRNLIYKDPRWKQTRMFVFARDNWTCVDCGLHDYRNFNRLLSCDHANEGGVMNCPDPFDPAYCKTRCNVCSGKKDGARGETRSA